MLEKVPVSSIYASAMSILMRKLCVIMYICIREREEETVAYECCEEEKWHCMSLAM